jgi:hypothetical protein
LHLLQMLVFRHVGMRRDRAREVCAIAVAGRCARRFARRLAVARE